VRLLGTNPISIAIPAGAEPAFQLDIATTMTSHGTIKVLAQAGEMMPEGWVIDAEGKPITDPSDVDEGYLMPIGGYKGSGLNMAIGLLAGVLNGAAFGSDVIDHRAVSDREANTGQAMFVMKPDLFRDIDDFRRDIDVKLAEMRAAGAPGAVRIPGEASRRTATEQRQKGVPIPDVLLTQLRGLAVRFELADDLS
jgi:L-2-hydroxycarboxylate dehydrogenase (NAD+)